MEALISGQAGTAVILGARAQVRPLGEAPRDPVPLALAWQSLQGCNDVVQRNVKNVRDADRIAHVSWQTDRALRLALLLIDPETKPGLSQEIAPLLEEMLASEDVINSIDARLYAFPLPENAFLHLSSLHDLPPVLDKIIKGVLGAQNGVAAARAAFEALDPENFSDERERALWLSSIVIQGSMRDLAKAIGDPRNVDFVALRAMGRHRALPNASNILRAWLNNFREDRKPNIAAPEYDADDDFEWESELVGGGQAGRRAFESAINQQSGIIRKVREGDYAAAREYADELVTSQTTNSTPEQIAKSLCRLAKSAKELGVPELQIEWSERAVEICPTDPIAYGHLADALIGVGNYSAADSSLSETERLGNKLYALNGRARILRAVGRPAEARDLYLEAAKAFPEEEGVEYSFAGAAETLRDMGRSAEALAEYERLVDRWPLESSFRNGLASTLAELGRFGEATRTYSQAASLDKTSVISLTGRASVAKMSGRLAEAEQIYRDAVKQYPSNSVAKCGLGEVLRLQGNFADARAAYEEARKASKLIPHPVVGLAEVYRDEGSSLKSLELIQSALGQFAYDRGVRLTHALALKWVGRYNDAMSEIDKVVAEFPYFISAQMARADILRSVGHGRHALRAYDAILSLRRNYSPAEVGKIAVLIQMGDYDAAERLLPDIVPHTQSEWSKYLLKAILLKERGSVKAAIRHLEKGVSKTPFSRMKRIMSNSLALIHIERRDYKTAFRVAVPMSGDPLNVIYLHSLAASHRTGQARHLLQSLSAAPQPGHVLALVDALGRSFGLTGGAPVADPRTRDVLLGRERALILAAA